MAEELKDIISSDASASLPCLALENLEEELDVLQKLKGEGEQESDAETENEVQKLKRLFLTFKKKYQQALKELAKREQSFDFSDISQKYQEAQEEIASLIAQQKQLKDRFLILKEEKKEGAIPEVASPSAFLLEEENQRLKKELASALSKLESAACAIEELQTPAFYHSSDSASHSLAQHKKLQQALQEKEKHLSDVLRAKNGWGIVKSELEEAIERFRQEKEFLERESVESKRNLSESYKEKEELQKKYQNITKEKEAILEQLGQLQKIFHQTQHELKNNQEELQSTISQIEPLKKEKHELHQLYEKEIHAKKEQENAFSSLSEQMQNLKKDLVKFQQQIKEKEESILEAKQHLAKKVKEVSLLNESIEEKNRQMGRLQEDLSESKGKVVEAQGALEAQTAQTQKIQEQLSACEEKYFRTYERLQEVEAQNRELKKIEEKHEHLQDLLGNLGSALGKPVGLNQPLGLVVPEALSQDPFSAKKKPKPKSPSTFSQGDLFDGSLSSKYKKDLFE